MKLSNTLPIAASLTIDVINTLPKGQHVRVTGSILRTLLLANLAKLTLREESGSRLLPSIQLELILARDHGLAVGVDVGTLGAVQGIALGDGLSLIESLVEHLAGGDELLVTLFNFQVHLRTRSVERDLAGSRLLVVTLDARNLALLFGTLALLVGSFSASFRRLVQLGLNFVDDGGI